MPDVEPAVVTQLARPPLRGIFRRLATTVVIAAACADVAAAPLKFDEVFLEQGGADALHYRALYAARGSEHRLEVWREAGLRVKRRTDDALETYAIRDADKSGFAMSILDLHKRIHTRIDRTNLLRIGSFTDWFSLAHSLVHPSGPYQLVAAGPPAGAPKPIESCRWYDLAENLRTTHICWSSGNSLPLLMQSQEGYVIWKVIQLDHNSLTAATFEIRDEGYIRNDANQDIGKD